MVVLQATLLPLGLFVILGLLFPSTSAGGDRCMTVFKVVNISAEPGIKVNSDVYERSTFYSIFIPVNKNISSVVLQALDKDNNSVGFWQNANEVCTNSVLYHVKNSQSAFLRTSWLSPNSTNITTVKLQVFTVNLDKVATLFSVELKDRVMSTTTTPKLSSTSTSKIYSNSTSKIYSTSTSKISSTSASKISSTSASNISSTSASKLPITSASNISSTSSQISTTKAITTPTPFTSSSANRAFFSPITDAIHILLVFLTSRLLF